MGWKGTLRAIEADYHRAQRNAARRRKELMRLQKEQAHRDELRHSAHEVEVYENHVEVLTSLHKDCSEPLDWNAIAYQPHPEEPAVIHVEEVKARAAFDAYVPNFVIKLLGLTNWRKKKLALAVEAGKAADEQATAEAQAQHRADTKEWERQTSLGKGVLAAHRQAVDAVLNQSRPFAEVLELGWQVGHASLETTQVYTHVSIRKLQEVHAETHPSVRRRPGEQQQQDHLRGVDDARQQPQPVASVEPEDQLLEDLAAEAEGDDEDHHQE
jgi:hypothetical protein